MRNLDIVKEMSGVRSDKKTAILIKWAAVAVGLVIVFLILIFGLKSCNNKKPQVSKLPAGTKEVATVGAAEPVTYDPDGFAEGDNMPKGMTKPAAKPETQPEETQPEETRPAETQAPSEMASPVEATMPSTVQPIITEEQQIAPTLEVTKDAKDEISPSSGVIENVTAKDERIQPSQQLPPNQGGSNAGGGWEVNHPTQATTPASSEKPTSPTNPISGTEEKGQATRGSSGSGSSKPQTTTAPKKLSIDSISYTPGAGTVNIWISGYDGQRVKVDGVTSNGDNIDLEYGRQLSGDRVNVKARVPSGTTLTEVRVSVGNINDSKNF